MRNARNWVLATVASGAFACDSTNVVVDPLTMDEATSLLRQLFELTEPAVEGRNVEDCPLGGEATVVYADGEWESGDTLWFSVRLVVTPDECAIGAGGDTLTTNGDPRVVIEGVGFTDFKRYAGLDLTVSGAVAWRRNDGGSDVCEMDMALEEEAVVDPDLGVLAGDVEGRLCGLEAAIPFSELVSESD